MKKLSFFNMYRSHGEAKSREITSYLRHSDSVLGCHLPTLASHRVGFDTTSPHRGSNRMDATTPSFLSTIDLDPWRYSGQRCDLVEVVFIESPGCRRRSRRNLGEKYSPMIAASEWSRLCRRRSHAARRCHVLYKFLKAILRLERKLFNLRHIKSL